VEKYVLVRNAKLKAMDKLVDKAAANKDRVFRSFTHNFAHNLILPPALRDKNKT
jgi:hypothetical protein